MTDTKTDTALVQCHFTSADAPFFALTDLPEAVKGALFARYSRSRSTLRELFLTEFVNEEEPGTDRARQLYRKVLGEYGDDSVAQLGSAHVACEGVSNVLTKVLERGRLMSYLEQSTRYVPYTDRPNGRWKYVTPAEIVSAGLRELYEQAMDGLFETYATLLPVAKEHVCWVRPQAEGEDDQAYARAVRAKALDTVRGLLPAATRSNVGIHGSGQAFEALLLRLRTTGLREASEAADGLRHALEQVIPDFVSRLDRDGRGGRWEKYLADRTRTTAAIAEEMDAGAIDRRRPAGSGTDVRLLAYDRDGEARVLAASVHPHSDRGLDELTEQVRRMDPAQVQDILEHVAGDRENRRFRPGRAFEHTEYLFEVTGDYGAFRDLQRHRMLTIDWERLTTRHGRTTPAAISEMGQSRAWSRAMDAAAEAHRVIAEEAGSLVAQYAVPMAYGIRFTMRINAREAMHMLELRTQPAGHPAYRAICQRMHELIRDEAGHRGIAAAMRHVNHQEVSLERMAAEQRSEAKRRAGRKD